MVDVRVLQEEFYDGARRAYSLSLIYDLKINDILNKEKLFMTTKEICDQIDGRQIKANYLERILRYLVCFGVFEEKYIDGTIAFKTTEFLKLPDIKHLTLLFKCSARYTDFLEGKTDGKPLFESTLGSAPWEFLGKEPYNQNFMAYMSTVSSQVIPILPKIVEEIKGAFRDKFTILDVGGSTGYMMKHIKDHMPKVRCLNFDLPLVIQEIPAIEGVEMVSGDMFDVKTLPKSDVVFTKNIFHDWSDEKCLDLLGNFHHVMADDGVLLSINYHLVEQGEEGYPNWMNRSMDITMMEVFGEAKERTLIDYTKLHQKAGFNVIRYAVLGPTERPAALLICKKTS